MQYFPIVYSCWLTTGVVWNGNFNSTHHYDWPSPHKSIAVVVCLSVCKVLILSKSTFYCYFVSFKASTFTFYLKPLKVMTTTLAFGYWHLRAGMNGVASCQCPSGRRCSDMILTIYYAHTIRITKINVSWKEANNASECSDRLAHNWTKAKWKWSAHIRPPADQ